jgi:mono/diheme cytochrome c family protein
MVHQRASALKQGWVPPSNLHEDRIYYQPAGEIFNTITNGVRNMQGYGSQLKAEERWAIILYVRALQKSRKTPSGQLPAEERRKLK